MGWGTLTNEVKQFDAQIYPTWARDATRSNTKYFQVAPEDVESFGLDDEVIRATVTDEQTTEAQAGLEVTETKRSKSPAAILASPWMSSTTRLRRKRNS